jgi:N-acetylneuraminic acid mutarotase
MTQPRCYHSATLLPTGEVLVAGGVDSLDNTPDTSATAELYNPSTGTWQTTGSMNTSRAGHGEVLENGQVLIAGGYNNSNGTTAGLAIAELYDPSKGSWSLTASMRLALDPAPLVLLPNSRVLVGNEAQFYNPTTAAWVSTGPLPTIARAPSQESLLDNGNVLANGTRCTYSGCGHVATNYCYLYTTSTNSWSRASSMNQPRLAPQFDPASQRQGTNCGRVCPQSQ